MIRKLRRRFILIAMISVTLVLIIILGAVNISNLIRSNRESDTLLTLLTENQGFFPEDELHPFPTSPEENSSPNKKNHSRPWMSAETPFETRFFSVILAQDGSTVRVNTRNIAAVSEAEAVSFATQVALSGNSSGNRGVYRYRTADIESGTLYVFLDRSREINTQRSFLLTSLCVSVGGLLAFFILILIFSKSVLRPVAESYQKQKRFITDASHELKTPLTVIDANAEVLEMEKGPSEWLDSIKNQVHRLSSLTGNLVALCRMDEESSLLTMVDFSLSDAVTETLEPFTVLARINGKVLTQEIASNLSYTGNERALRQLITQLADNAIKYSDPNGTIRFSLKKQGKRCVLECYNTTESLTPGNQDVLFERFYRTDASRTSGGGSGIGLSVVQAIVNAHNGKIHAYSEDGHSLTITVTL